ncbi:MAG: hypothetical protein RLY16_2255 [Bacteroidota bacterium]|jgi:ABC-type multidrug transport system fused ATPase/permease subunit
MNQFAPYSPTYNGITIVPKFKRVITFLSALENPSVLGLLMLYKDSNNNYVINIQITHLPAVETRYPSKMAYVIWLESVGRPLQNIGKIVSSIQEGQANLNAFFETVSAQQPTGIFISAEAELGEQSPTLPFVLTASVFD